MKEQNYWQCQVCGYVHQENDVFDIEDSLFVQKYCPKCRDRTKHLWVGTDKDEIYENYNLNLDPRYYKY